MIVVCKDGRRTGCKYVCPNCVSVSKELLPLAQNSGQQPSIRTAAELAKLKETINEKEKTIKKYKTNEQHLLEIVESQKQDLTELKKKLSNDPAFHTIEYVVLPSKLEKKLEDFRTEILSTLREECSKSYPAAVSSNQETTTQSNDIKTAVKEVREEEAAEEMDKIRRSKNLIIHGVDEPTEDETQKDETWVKTLVKTLRARVDIKRISRIGKSTNGKQRPLIVTLNSEEEKQKVFGNLPVLKGIETYKGVSICEDLTVYQRKKYKELAADAKAKNQTEKDGVWRVRGSAKNGFRLKKMNANRQ